jgi:plasmid stability protein
MATLVQIRDVPEDVHRILKSRAAAGGVSLSEYLRTLLERDAARPTAEELRARIAARGVVELSEPSEITVRRLRDAGE